MSTWKRLRALLAAVVGRLPGVRHQQHQQQRRLHNLRATLALLALLRQARTLRQVQAVHQLAALLPRVQTELVNSLALETIPRLPFGSESPKNSESRRKTAPSTPRRRRRR